MKVIMTCQPALGHFHPMVPLARALNERGHEVAFVSSPSFCEYIAQAGLTAIAAGLDWLVSDFDQTFPSLADSGFTVNRALNQAFASSAGKLIPDLLTLLCCTHPDLLIAENTVWAGVLAAEAAKVPHAIFGLGVSFPRALLREMYGKEWNQARNALGLPRDPNIRRLCPFLYLDAYPPSMQPFPVYDISPAVQSIRPVPYEIGNSEPPPWLDTIHGRPLVYVTMGTVFNRSADALKRILDALCCEPLHIIATTGSNYDICLLNRISENVRVERYIPQSVIMERADLVVCHAGYNTMMGALSRSLPMLCLPLGADQFYNAFRVGAAGVGLQLNLESTTAVQLREAVRQLTEDPTYGSNARRLQREIAQMPPVEHAIPSLECLARGARN